MLFMSSNVSPNENMCHNKYRLYRAAIAMNNMGVSFLQRNSYMNAFDAFKKALTIFELLNSTFKGSDKEKETEPYSMDVVDYNCQYVASASKKLAARSTKTTRNNKNIVQVCVINLDTDSNFEALCSIVNEITTTSNSNQRQRYAIQIEVFDDNINDSSVFEQQQRLQMECSIILYNLGSACYMYGAANDDSRTGRVTRKSSVIYEKWLNICQGSYDILLTMQTNCDTNKEYNDIDYCFQTRRIGLLTMLVLQSLWIGATKLNDCAMAVECHTQFGIVRAQISDSKKESTAHDQCRSSDASCCIQGTFDSLAAAQA